MTLHSHKTHFNLVVTGTYANNKLAMSDSVTELEINKHGCCAVIFNCYMTLYIIHIP